MFDFLVWVFGLRRCRYCSRLSWSVTTRRQSTAYVDDKLNYITCCAECYEATEEYWEERWAGYYGDVL